MKYLIAIIAVACLLCPVAMQAANYKVSLTRKDSNLYKVDGEDIYIRTKYCYEYGYGEQCILKLDGYLSQIVFINSGSKCEVEGAYRLSNQSSGTYTVSVSRVTDNWYEVFGQGIYIKTSMCLSLALATESYLKINPGGSGVIVIDRDKCDVEGLYSKIQAR